jgi:hypothetical protein
LLDENTTDAGAGDMNSGVELDTGGGGGRKAACPPIGGTRDTPRTLEPPELAEAAALLSI